MKVYSDGSTAGAAEMSTIISTFWGPSFGALSSGLEVRSRPTAVLARLGDGSRPSADEWLRRRFEDAGCAGWLSLSATAGEVRIVSWPPLWSFFSSQASMAGLVTFVASSYSELSNG